MVVDDFGLSQMRNVHDEIVLMFMEFCYLIWKIRMKWKIRVCELLVRLLRVSVCQ